MKEFLVNSNKKACSVVFNITTNGQTPIYITGFDPFTPNTFYFKSRFLITGQEEITVNCPQSPNRLKIYIWSDNNQEVTVNSIYTMPLERIEFEDEWIKFIERFSRREAMLKPGLYVADIKNPESVPFKIEIVRKIYNENGTEHPTPARINADKPLIQVSKNKFDAMAIPERIVILLHEASHNFINNNPDDEQEADDHAVYIYKSLGYPKIEAMNAFANVMPDTDENYERMLNLINI